ncbi:MAG: AAA family ATPase [Patescibacteria group bacterium]|nr:AAA family ATPase [Patescibacteria group bacterium]
MIAIGLTGKSGSGKDTAADYLKEKGFFYYSLSDIIREECEKRGLEKKRDNLIKIGNELRKKNGPSVLADKTIRKIRNKNLDKVIISSIRNSGEVKSLKKLPKFILINVEVPVQIRFQRIKKRKREDDSGVSLEKFKEQEERESLGNDPAKQQLNKVIQMSDYDIDNSGSLDNLYQGIDKVLKKENFET